MLKVTRQDSQLQLADSYTATVVIRALSKYIISTDADTDEVKTLALSN